MPGSPRSILAVAFSCAASLLMSSAAHAQTAPAPPPAVPSPPLEIDQNLVNLPTTMSLKRTPRTAGHDPDRAVWAVAAEKRTRSGGHTLALTLTNSFATTFGQLARGGSEHDVYLRFNITRQF